MLYPKTAPTSAEFPMNKMSMMRQRLGLAALYSYLVSPLLIQAAQHGFDGLRDSVYVLNFPLTALWIALAHFATRRPLYLHLLLLPLYITTTADLFLLKNFGTRLSSGYLGIALGNQSDTGDFIAAFWQPIAMVIVLFLLIYLAGLFCIRDMRKPRSPMLAGAAAVGLFSVYAFLFHHFNYWSSEPASAVLMDMAAHESSAPVGAIFQAASALKVRVDDGALLNARASYTFHASKAAATDDEVYVFVIGESSRPQNWSLFGYGRDTTPKLRAIPGMLTFPNMMSTAPETRIAVPSLLSLRPISEWSSIRAEKSIVSAFQEVGFKTYWLSTQEVDGWAGVIPHMANEASAVRYFADSFDGAVLAQLRNILQEKSPAPRKLFIVVHTKGSHFDYLRRYPSGFSLFSSPHPTRRDSIVDAYDNSVYYTDWFLDQVISMLSEQHTRAALFYSSDHGENLLDDDRQILGHTRGTRYDLPAAAFLWVSEPLRRAQPDMISDATEHAGLPLSISNLPHSLLDLAGIRTPASDSTMSIFSSRFESRPRSFMVGDKVVPEANADKPR